MFGSSVIRSTAREYFFGFLRRNRYGGLYGKLPFF
jgi:hypothetical protein